ncbi:MAG: hypothetical protein BWY28_01497 [bacterium ADurb.Bin236]|nr:MAG: hypothetical protein BWY28_01497 [bacterium ADurb.Bin236]
MNFSLYVILEFGLLALVGAAVWVALRETTGEESDGPL